MTVLAKKTEASIRRPTQPDLLKTLRGRVPRSRLPRVVGATIFLCLIAAVGATGWWIWRSRQAGATSHFITRLVDRGPISQTVMTTGTLQPTQTVTIGSQISGQIVAVYVNYNSKVKKGQLLARIDPSTQLTQREQARADVESADGAVQSADASISGAGTGIAVAEAAVDSAQASVVTAQTTRQVALAQLAEAQAGVNKTNAQLVLDRLTYDRNVALSGRDLIARSDLDAARATLQKTQADLQSAQAQVAVARAGIANADASISNARAQLQSAIAKRGTADAQLQTVHAQRNQAAAQRRKATASLGQIDVNLRYAEIRSPVDGVVISRLVDPGQTVAASFQTPALFTVATDLRRMQAIANVDESDISRVFVGQTVSFTVNAWPGEIFRGGRVTLIRNSPQTVQNVVTYQVLIDIDNHAVKLRPGMTAALTLMVAERPQAVRVPNSALRLHPDELGVSVNAPALARGMQRVWMLNGDSLRSRDVKVGITDGAMTEVVDGALKDGDSVVVSITGATAGGAPRASEPSAAASRTRSPQLRMPGAGSGR